LSFWVPPSRKPEFLTDYRSRVVPILERYGLVDGSDPTDVEPDSLFSRLFVIDSPVDVREKRAALEIRVKIAGMFEAAGKQTSHHDELRRIVAIDADAGGDRTPRTRYLAATSALVLSEIPYEQFTELALTQPFARSLAEKRARMDAAMSSFERLVDYQVAEVTAAATFYIAEIYSHFGRALIESERPSDLAATELADYELAIEEEAFPFEESAIEVHEKNLELMVAGTFNGWVQRSLDQLAVLMPGRYAKVEISSGFVGPVEVFAYRSPALSEKLAGAQNVSAAH
ncbi:MAG: hypothetical protein O7E57_08590, partial [Gammaproteobacteria bacterium]|nr:hypothetical protein [Gammaproteobacteria bacterium]